MQGNNPVQQFFIGGESLRVIPLPSTNGMKKEIAIEDARTQIFQESSLAVFSICNGTPGGSHYIIDGHLFEQKNGVVPRKNIKQVLGNSLYVILPDNISA